jgi:hypothetical protein
MHEDRPRALGGYLLANFGDLFESLAAERAAKMAQKDQKDRRFIRYVEERAAGVGVKVSQGRDQFSDFRGMWLD